MVIKLKMKKILRRLKMSENRNFDYLTRASHSPSKHKLRRHKSSASERLETSYKITVQLPRKIGYLNDLFQTGMSTYIVSTGLPIITHVENFLNETVHSHALSPQGRHSKSSLVCKIHMIRLEKNTISTASYS